MSFVFLPPQWVNWQALWDKWVVCSGCKAAVLFCCGDCVSYGVFCTYISSIWVVKIPPSDDWGTRAGVAKSPGARRALLLMETWHTTSWFLGRRTQSNPWHAQALTREQTMWKETKWLTLLTVVELVELTRFRLPLAKNQVVSDVSIGVVGRFPLEDDLGRGVGWRDGVQRDGRF